MLALISEFLGASISAPEQMMEATGTILLGVIPVIRTYSDQKIRKRRIVWAAISGATLTVMISCAAVFYYRAQ